MPCTTSTRLGEGWLGGDGERGGVENKAGIEFLRCFQPPPNEKQAEKEVEERYERGLSSMVKDYCDCKLSADSTG